MDPRTAPSADWLEIVRYLDPTGYDEVYREQIRRRNLVESGESGNALILCEHTPVITLGRNAHADHVLATREALARLGIDVISTDRGGDVTYHGPGQLVAYPILNLDEWRRSVSGYLRLLEEVLIRTLAFYGIIGSRLESHTGVWVGGGNSATTKVATPTKVGALAKVGAIGVGVHQWVTYHGIALNIAPDMTHFSLIVPCGIPDKPVTSLEQILGYNPPMTEVVQHFELAFAEIFGAARQGEHAQAPAS